MTEENYGLGTRAVHAGQDDTQGRVIGPDEDPNLAAETALLVLSKNTG